MKMMRIKSTGANSLKNILNVSVFPTAGPKSPSKMPSDSKMKRTRKSHRYSRIFLPLSITMAVSK